MISKEDPTGPMVIAWIVLCLASCIHVFLDSRRDPHVGHPWMHAIMCAVLWPLPYILWLFWWPGKLRQAIFGPDIEKAHRWARQELRTGNSNEASHGTALPRRAATPGTEGRMKRRIALSILVLSAVVVVYAVSHLHAERWRRPPFGATRADINNIKDGLALYHLDCRAYPTVPAGLGSLVTNTGVVGWKGPYLTAIPADEWGQAFRYSLNEDGPEIRSAGPDTTFDTVDDIAGMCPK